MDARSGEPFDFDCTLPRRSCVAALGAGCASWIGWGCVAGWGCVLRTASASIWKSSALLFVHRSPCVNAKTTVARQLCAAWRDPLT